MQLTKCFHCSFVSLAATATCPRCGAAQPEPNAGKLPPDNAAAIALMNAWNAPASDDYVAENAPAADFSLPAPDTVWNALLPPAAEETFGDTFAQKHAVGPENSAWPSGYNVSQEQFGDNRYVAPSVAGIYNENTPNFSAQAGQRPAWQGRQLPPYVLLEDNSATSPSGAALGMVVKCLLYPALGLLIVMGAWKIALPYALESPEDPTLPKAANPWFKSWFRKNPTAGEVLKKAQAASVTSAVPNAPTSLYMKGAVEMALPAPPSRPTYQGDIIGNPAFTPTTISSNSVPPPAVSDYQPAPSLQWQNPIDTKSGTFEAAANEKNQATMSFTLSVSPKSVYSKETFDGLDGWKDLVLYVRDSGSWRIENSKRENMAAPEIESLKKMANLNSLVSYNTPKAEWRGKANVNGRLAYSIETKDESGDKQILFFDAESGLLVAADATISKAAKTLQMTIFFDDYRETQGLRMPFCLRYKITSASISMSFTIKLDKLSINEPIDPNLFVKTDIAQINVGGVTVSGIAAAHPSLTSSPTPTTGIAIRQLPPVYTTPRPEPPPQREPEPKQSARPAKSGNGLFEGLIPPKH